MNDDLAAEAATWVPPWQRPATGSPEPAGPQEDEEGPPSAGEAVAAASGEASADASDAVADVADDAVGIAEQDPNNFGEIARIKEVAGSNFPEIAQILAEDPGEHAVVPEQRVAEVAEPSVLAAPPPGLPDDELVPALEAILMVVDEPVSEFTLAEVLDIPAAQVADALLVLSARYTEEGRGFDLRRAAGGWRFYTRAEYSSYVERFVLDGQQLRLTQASLETLAVVAYKQPVSRSRISAIRGVNCDGVIRTLITRGMVEECGTDPDSGAHLYRTTTLFLEKLGLDSVEQLPPLAPFLPDNLDEVANG